MSATLLSTYPLAVRVTMLALFCCLTSALFAATGRHRAVTPPTISYTVSARSVSLTLVSPPQPAIARSAAILAWELVVENDRAEDVTIQELHVTSGGEDQLEYVGADLRPNILNVPDRGATPQTPRERIRPGELAIIYLWMTARSLASVPTEISHRMVITAASGTDTLEGPGAAIANTLPITIAAPVAGDKWLAANGPSNDSLHRRALYLVDGRYFLAQRFAIDWVRVDDHGSTFSGLGTQNTSYYAYGTSVLAVVDATVASTRDGLGENVPGQLPPFSIDTAPGNYVILDLGNGKFALYAHLKPGSLLVHSGDHVSRGQTLARIGNSGNSTQPHLHFHVCNANSPLLCDGVPYGLDHFIAEDGGHLSEIPLENDLVDFR